MTSTPSTRKRVLSNPDDSSVPEHRIKRPRVSLAAAGSQLQLLGGPLSVTTWLDRLPKARSLHDDVNLHLHAFPSPATPLSRCSSFTSGSRACSPGVSTVASSEGSTFISRSGMALMRSVSSASMRSSSPSTPSYPESSAKYHLRNTRATIDFSLPVTEDLIGVPLLSCSLQNILFFSRGNRVHYKNLTSTEEIGQLCRLQESHGDLQIVQCGGSDQPDIVALGTSKGLVQIWDLKTKRMTSSWSTKGVSAMKWNGPVLTMGGLKGTIRHYDTRISPTLKMKEQVRKVTRHQARITSLDWSVEGNILASGDESGTVYCWDSRQKVPLDVGEFVQRRKKMQHEAAVRVVSWCPWQPKLLASGDIRGTVRLWNINANSPHSNATVPGRLDLGSAVTGIHFSPHCKELLTTHGASINPTINTDSPTWSPASTVNSLAVHSYPSLRHITTLSVADKPIEGSVLNPNGTKIIVAIPDDNKLHVCDVWSKRKELKKQPSFMSSSTIR